MLLRHTTADVMERSALTINPAKTCQPIGAMYAALGIHNCLPHSHGSQGCCSYHRSTLTRHYKEPVMAGTSSFTEGAAVFGGQANLLQAITNMFTLYNPDVVAIHTTCLSETIGDDIVQIISKAREEGKVPAGKHLIHANTPSYIGSHVTGFSNMVKGMVKYLCEASGRKRNQVNIMPGWVEPSDMRELRRLSRTMGINPNIFPDTSDVLDAPQTGEHEFYPTGRRARGGDPPRRRQPVHHRARSDRFRSRRAGAGGEVRGAFRSPGTAHRPPGHGPLHQRAAPPLRHPRAGIHYRRTRPPGGHDRGHAPVLLPQTRGSLRRSRPTGLAHRVPGDHGHASRLHRDRDSRQALRNPHRRGAGRRRPRGPGPPGAAGRHVPAAPVDQEAGRGPADRQHLWEVHRPRRGHSLRALRLPHHRPRGPLLFPHGRLHGRACAWPRRSSVR